LQTSDGFISCGNFHLKGSELSPVLLLLLPSLRFQTVASGSFQLILFIFHLLTTLCCSLLASIQGPQSISVNLIRELSRVLWLSLQSLTHGSIQDLFLIFEIENLVDLQTGFVQLLFELLHTIHGSEQLDGNMELIDQSVDDLWREWSDIETWRALETARGEVEVAGGEHS
jgi:hypothetical protein